MSKAEWFTYASLHKANLKDLLTKYHPAKLAVRNTSLLITARNAESACEIVRGQIRRNFEGDPVELFDKALENRDVGTVMNLLSDAWFGVPESTECWDITGFKEAVDLMDDPPDTEEVNE